MIKRYIYRVASILTYFLVSHFRGKILLLYRLDEKGHLPLV